MLALQALLLLASCAQVPPAQAGATLQLRLQDRATSEAREGDICLWRVEIPAEPGFTAGDERVGDYSVLAAGLAIPDLAPGRYRATCAVHARSGAELPPFEVKSPQTEIVLRIDPPQEREVWVEIFDVQGQVFEQAEYKPSSRSGRLRVPKWVHPRRTIQPDGSELPGPTVGGFTHSTSAHSSWRKLRRGAHGFSLGREREDTGLYETTRWIQVRVPDHGSVSGTLTFDGHEELRYRALLIEKGSFEGLFTLPDGSELNLGRLHLQTPLEPDVLPRPAEWWLDVPVQIAIQAPGCKRLELEFRLREGLPKPRTLEKAP